MTERLTPAEHYHPEPDGTALDSIYCTIGRKLTADAAEKLVSDLKIDAFDLKARLKLLGYYRKFQDRLPEAEARQEHVLWMIENRSSDYICGTELVLFWHKLSTLNAQSEKAWKEAIKANPNDPVVIGNAGLCLSVILPKVARKYLRKSLEIQPDNHNLLECLKGVEEHLSFLERPDV